MEIFKLNVRMILDKDIEYKRQILVAERSRGLLAVVLDVVMECLAKDYNEIPTADVEIESIDNFDKCILEESPVEYMTLVKGEVCIGTVANLKTLFERAMNEASRLQKVCFQKKGLKKLTLYYLSK